MAQIRMGFSSDAIKAPEPVNEDLYTVRIEGFKPALSSAKTSINYNPVLRILSGKNTGAEFAGKSVFENLNSGAPWIMNDFVHAAGLPLDKIEETGELTMPGGFEGSNPEDPSTWKYVGPLVGRTLEVYVIKSEYNNKPNNKIKYYVCALPDCNTKYPEVKHSTNLVK